MLTKKGLAISQYALTNISISLNKNVNTDQKINVIRPKRRRLLYIKPNKFKGTKSGSYVLELSCNAPFRAPLGTIYYMEKKFINVTCS